MYAIITSKDCPAGKNIRESLLRIYEFSESGTFDNNKVYELGLIKLYTIDETHIYAENIDKKIPEEYLIFATTHRSEKGVHSLSCHAPGNWGKADYGGKDNSLCKTSALLLKKAYLALLKQAHKVPNHDITLEVTHHGPYTEKPSIFIEIGSTEEHWGNVDAGDVVAVAIIELVTEELENQKIAIGIGGPHYANNFNKVFQREEIAISHFCPKYNLENLNEEMLTQAIEKTKEKVDFILVDYKGLGKEKQRIKELLEKMDLEWKRTDRL